MDSPVNNDTTVHTAWPQPQEVQSIDSTVRLINTTRDPVFIRRNEHLCQLRALTQTTTEQVHRVEKPRQTTINHCKPYSSSVSVDPDGHLPLEYRQKFTDLHTEYDHVFNPSIAKYNGASGDIKAVVNMGPAQPPQRKGRIPQYNRETSIQLQNKFDELEAEGVFARPEDIGITVEYLNLSFLIRKPNGGTRLVTSFGEVAKYAKPQPSLMPNVDNVLREIARWRYVIITDLHRAFYQVPLAKSSMKYCGVATPFKGIRVYTRSAMGMPGSETSLEELLS